LVACMACRLQEVRLGVLTLAESRSPLTSSWHLDVSRRHELHLMTQALELTRPVMGACTSLDADQAGWQASEEADELAAAELTADQNLSCLINAVDLKHVLAISRPMVVTRIGAAPCLALRQAPYLKGTAGSRRRPLHHFWNRAHAKSQAPATGEAALSEYLAFAKRKRPSCQGALQGSGHRAKTGRCGRCIQASRLCLLGRSLRSVPIKPYR
jgi:hypothetical protein